MTPITVLTLMRNGCARGSWPPRALAASILPGPATLDYPQLAVLSHCGGPIDARCGQAVLTTWGALIAFMPAWCNACHGFPSPVHGVGLGLGMPRLAAIYLRCAPIQLG